MRESIKYIVYFIVMVLVFFISAYFFNSGNILNKPQINITYTEPPNSSSSPPKWASFPLSYYFTNESVCGDYQANRMKRAFEIIKNQTNGAISFIENNNTGNINIICLTDYRTGEVLGAYTSGEGSYISSGSTITGGQINILHMGAGRYSGGCANFPNIEIHEIMHTFALQHSNISSSVMYPVSSSRNCISDRIDNETINVLNSIYHFK
jgi:hypothetical protein